MFPTCWQCSWVRATTLLHREVAMMSTVDYPVHPDKGVDELRECVGATITFLTATSNQFYSAASLKSPSRYWGNLIPAD